MHGSTALALLVGAGMLCAAAQAAQEPAGLDLHLGASLLRFDFREYADTGRQLVRELGVLPGLAGRIGQTIGRWQWSAEIDYFSGGVDYHGQTQSGANFDTTTDTVVVKTRARALWLLDPQGRFAAGLGFGYRQWQRHIRGRGNVSGLDERFSAGDLSVDTRLSLLRSEAAVVDADLRLAWPIRPQVRIDFGGLYDSQTLVLGPRLSTRVSVPASWTVGPRTRIVVEPGFEAWGFGRSGTETLYRDGVPAGVVYQPQGKGYNFELNFIWVQSF
jgi:Outer membrane protein beta-barrel domain